MKFIDFLLSQIQINLTDIYAQNSHNSIATKEKERKQNSLLMRECVMFERSFYGGENQIYRQSL